MYEDLRYHNTFRANEFVFPTYGCVHPIFHKTSQCRKKLFYVSSSITHYSNSSPTFLLYPDNHFITSGDMGMGRLLTLTLPLRSVILPLRPEAMMCFWCSRSRVCSLEQPTYNVSQIATNLWFLHFVSFVLNLACTARFKISLST